MRVAVMVIALCLTMLVGLQSCVAGFGGELIKDEATAQAGAIGIALAFVFILGAAFVIGFPRFAGGLFLVGGVLAITASAGSQFGDLAVWGGASLLLALMAFIGARELRRRDRYRGERYVDAPGYEASGPGFEYAPDARSPLLTPVLATLALAAVVIAALLASGVLRLGPPAKQVSASNEAAAMVDDGPIDTSVEGVGEIDVPTTPASTPEEGEGEIDVPATPASSPASSDTDFTDATGRTDDVSSVTTPEVTPSHE